MSDSSDGGLPPAEESRAVPHRVIGTPAPAQAASLLRESEPDSKPPAPRELPAGPPDPARAKRAERVVAGLFVLSALAGVGFIVAYLVLPVGSPGNVEHSNMALGGALAAMFLALAIGATIWVRHLMPTVELTEERHPLRSADEDRAAFAQTFREGAETSQFKRPLLRRTLILAGGIATIAPLVVLRDTGPLPGKSLDFTVWRKGLRLITYGTNRPLTPADFSSPGSMITVAPQGYENDFDAMAKAAVIIIKFHPGQIVFGKAARPGSTNVTPSAVVPNWTVDNIVAYSKICTHVGCPAALYEQTTMHILCPCHQSTFDAPRGAEVIFGPATRPLPQLPIGVDAQGYLIALSDFNQPVGPSFWERGPSPA